MSQSALIIIDVQRDYFPQGKFPLVGIEQASRNIELLLDAARRTGVPVIHVKHEFPFKEAPFFVAGEPGTEIHDSVMNKGQELVIVKNYANAFRDTDLKAQLDGAGVDTVVIVGAMTHMCVDATTRAAADLGYQAVLVHDAIATRDVTFGDVTVPAAHVHAAFLGALAFGYAKIVSTTEHLGALASRS